MRNVQSDVENCLSTTGANSCPCLASLERLLSSLTLFAHCAPGSTHNMFTAFQKKKAFNQIQGQLLF